MSESLAIVQGVFLLLQIAVFIATPIVLTKKNSQHINGMKNGMQFLKDEIKEVKDSVENLNQNFIEHLNLHASKK
jgi:hypothetical protein